MRRNRASLVLIAGVAGALLLALALAPARVGAAPRARLWDFWLEHDPRSSERVSHTTWDIFLGHYLSNPDGIALFDYGAVSTTDRRALGEYIGRLGTTAVRSLSREEQLAFWINLYNALTVQVVLDFYPVESIKMVPSRLLPLGPWDNKLIAVEGKALTLNDIEHRILRPIWQDPRLHYALNCASIGCPNLAARAYTAARMEEMLETAAKTFVNHRRAVQVRGSRIRVSSIYHWYARDFGDTPEEIIDHIQQYARPTLRERLRNAREIGVHHYDWSLNDGG